MLGWLLLGAIAAVAIITIVVTYLDKDVAKIKLKENGISIKFNTQKIMEICPFNLFVFDYSISAMKKHTISLIEKEI